MGQATHGGQLSCMGAARGPAGRAVVRLMEIAGGGGAVGRRAIRHDDGLQDDSNPWRRLCLRLGLSIEVVNGCLDDLMRPGPLVVVTSAPPSLIAPVVLGHILAARPGGFRILAPRALAVSSLVAAAGLGAWLVPVAPRREAGAAAVNRAALSEARAVLCRGGAVVWFGGLDGVGSRRRSALRAVPCRGVEGPAARRAGRLAAAAAGAVAFAGADAGADAGAVEGAVAGSAMGPAPAASAASAERAGAAAAVVHVRLDCDGIHLAGLAGRLHPTLGLGLILPAIRCGCDRSVRVAIGGAGPDVQDVMAFRRTASYA